MKQIKKASKRVLNTASNGFLCHIIPEGAKIAVYKEPQFFLLSFLLVMSSV